MFAEQADVAISVHSMLSDKKITKKEGMIGRLRVCTGTEISLRHVLHVLKFYLKKGTYINGVTKQLLFVFSRVLLCLLSLFSAFWVSFFCHNFLSWPPLYDFFLFFHELAKLDVVTA
jgi:hypothetical protein